MDTPKDIYTKLAAVMNEIQPIAKGQNNKQQGWSFRGIDDIYNELQPLFAKHGILTAAKVLKSESIERSTKSGGSGHHTVIHMAYAFVSTSDMSSYTTESFGEAFDPGDKSYTKAMAIAHKYALLQAFMIPTKEEKDPDFQTHETKPKALMGVALQPKTRNQNFTPEELKAADGSPPPQCELCHSPMRLSKSGLSYYCPNFKDETNGKHSQVKL